MSRLPSNTDILHELTDIKKTLAKHEKYLEVLNNWRTGELAVDNYRKTHKNSSNNLNKEFIAIILKFLTVLSTVLGILYLLVKEVLV